ncbi:hypothetical protein Gbro_1734 [Gordonia bronchialis DSM 43247]|uniref:Uncharacterized protein n=1 Tax=Gordonia bronchialis (strain ATCC 25592 / DSM 43247 / BCRC 13721 / JCM 3198 / KCTC 3076 / NBRC 16047 / NCTC 10667) TaxID=526226 RepID=D0L8H9_GORB4|nr:hypothetical protein [Gordonia bronchialis]ACY20996.1 hypothetical protein Gbro_1734 [Gordonia bronchialis DSM 43247]MCC3323772.1 hypothetical protein [Gordonia bronchialis]QGS25284.1 hypothetical protein FOB84_15195 [Gordonia bronchialis]UAK38297.1 hypothetical protein K8O93_00360 [Gordonia bronchialis]STQ63849.1 Uncharacterised protein [Gordonia bronchialis]
MNRTDQTGREIERHRSPGLVIFGIVALAVAAWGLADGPELPDPSNLGWLVVAVGLVIGLLLIVTGARSKR